MAAIDKIYVKSYDQYLQFKNWCIEQFPIKDKYGKNCYLSEYLINWRNEKDFTISRPIYMAPYYVDAYLIRNCPFDFIQDNLKLNYGYYRQEMVDEMYKTVMDRGGVKCNPGEGFYWWADKDSFDIIDGTIIYKGNNDSSYVKIIEGKLYSKPYVEYVAGTHYKCIQQPTIKYNTPYKIKCWNITIDCPNNFLWYHENHNTWDFAEEFVSDDSTSNCCYKIRTIKALKRMLIKWKLPIGCIVSVDDWYDTYKFIITE